MLNHFPWFSILNGSGCTLRKTCLWSRRQAVAEMYVLIDCLGFTGAIQTAFQKQSPEYLNRWTLSRNCFGDWELDWDKLISGFQHFCNTGDCIPVPSQSPGQIFIVTALLTNVKSMQLHCAPSSGTWLGFISIIGDQFPFLALLHPWKNEDFLPKVHHVCHCGYPGDWAGDKRYVAIEVSSALQWTRTQPTKTMLKTWV